MHEMFSSILKNYPKLDAILRKAGKDREFLGIVTEEKLKAVVGPLAYIKSAIRSLEPELHPTLQLVIPTLEKLQLIFGEEKSGDHTFTRQLKRRLASSIQSKCVSSLSWRHWAAVLLNPVTVEESYENCGTDMREEAKEKIKEMLERLSDLSAPSTDEHSTDEPSAEQKSVEIDGTESTEEEGDIDIRPDQFDMDIDDLDIFGDISCDGEAIPFENELDDYLEYLPVYAENRKKMVGKNPLLYWTENSGKYPNLYAISKGILSSMASNTSSERIFSVTNLVLRKERARLEDNKIGLLTFLHDEFEKRVDSSERMKVGRRKLIGKKRKR